MKSAGYEAIKCFQSVTYQKDLITYREMNCFAFLSRLSAANIPHSEFHIEAFLCPPPPIFSIILCILFQICLTRFFFKLQFKLKNVHS